MKKTHVILMCLILFGCSQADFLGIKNPSETIVVPVHPPLDSSGIPGTPDSIQVVTYADDGASKAYSCTGTGYSCTGIDTTCDYGGTHIWFIDQIQDIDGDGGNVELAIQVIAWIDDLPTYTLGSVQVVSDSLENFLDAARDSSSSAAVTAKNCLDTLQSQDNWVGNIRYAYSDSVLSLRGLHIRGTVSGDTGLVVVGHTDGAGAYFSGGSGDAHGLYLRGSGTGNGLLTQADGTGHGIRSQGGLTSGIGILAEARGGNTAGWYVQGHGTGSGFYALGGADGPGSVYRGGSTSGSGLLCESQAGNGDGIAAQGSGTGRDFNFTFDLDDMAGTLDAAEIGAGSIGSDQLAQSAADKIADEIFDEDTSSHNVAGTYGVLWKDTSAYQGAASSLDSGTVQRISNRGLDSIQTATVISGTIDSIAAGGADAIWNEPQSGHSEAGTFGYYLDAAVSSIESPAGSGSYPVTIAAIDSSSAQVIPGARLTVHNLELTTVMAIGSTGSDGKAGFNLDSAGYIVSATAPGYIFNAYDSITVDGAGEDTIAGYPFDPGSPSMGDLCRVYGFIYGIDGQPLEGVEVAAQITAGVVRHNTAIISPYHKSAITDSTGYFYLDLIPSDSLVPADMEYLITATYPAGIVLKKKILIPAAESWMLSW